MSSSDTVALAGHQVHRVGFGAMQLPGPGVFGPPKDHDTAIAVLRRAVEAGVNHIDTAQFYGPDVANELIHEALHPYPDGLFLVSKVGARRDADGAWHAAQTPALPRADCRPPAPRSASGGWRGAPPAAMPTARGTRPRRRPTCAPAWRPTCGP